MMTTEKEKAGFIGLGNMGHPMAQNLEKAGFKLSVYNRTPEKTADFDGKSKVCETISDLLESSDIIFTMLTNDDAVKAVFDEILKENIEGKLFVDMSTISPELSKKMAHEISEKGAGFADAPVSGSTKPAEEGTLIILAGGSEKDVKRATPFLEKMGKEIKHLGNNGKGIAAKLSINYFIATIFQGLAETVLLSTHLGIDKKDMLDIINEGGAGSAVTKGKSPLLINDDFAPAFALELMLKDVLLAVNAGADTPLAKVLAETYQSAKDEGFGKEDVIGIINYLKK